MLGLVTRARLVSGVGTLSIVQYIIVTVIVLLRSRNGGSVGGRVGGEGGMGIVIYVG
jgi:hypothetical protein